MRRRAPVVVGLAFGFLILVGGGVGLYAWNAARGPRLTGSSGGIGMTVRVGDAAHIGVYLQPSAALRLIDARVHRIDGDGGFRRMDVAVCPLRGHGSVGAITGDVRTYCATHALRGTRVASSHDAQIVVSLRAGQAGVAHLDGLDVGYSGGGHTRTTRLTISRRPRVRLARS